MKLVRYGKAGKEKPGVIDAKGKLRDCSHVVPDLAGEYLSHKHLKKIAKALKDGELKAVGGTPRIGACVGRPCNFVAVGLNYADHAAESNMPVPTEPILFNKAPNCIVGPNDDVVIPRNSQKCDWEVELGIVIGKQASYISEDDVMDHIAGFCLANDVSEREFQLERGGNWMKGKSAPTFGPLGPWLVTPDEIKDVQNLGMWLDVNGERMQTGSTKTMIFNVKKIVSYTSQFLTLEPGDVIVTGTPPGVGSGKKPPRFLRAGDTMRLGIDGLGEQACRVIAHGKEQAGKKAA
ncbi:MAG: fumarylacetoacetate hydrolase family protein [Hyphomicrobiales bacterium]|nr:fumarylacetoacetate hydrolase family protein [Hyphomicrobiales bacterium]